MKTLLIQKTNKNEYKWKYYDDIEYPEFSFQINRPFNWNKKTNITKERYPISKRNVLVGPPKLHKSTFNETTIDSIDFYLYVLKLESMVDGNMYI